MSSRFFHPTPIRAQHVVLDGPEAHHLLHVGRATVGQEVTLFDGSGGEFVAVIEKLGRSTVELRIVERLEVVRELPFVLTVGVALPKGDRQKWLVEKLAEVGVSALVPLQTERGVAQPTSGALDRLRRTVIEASKQCGRNRLLQITSPQAWDSWARQDDLGVRRLVAHPDGTPLSDFELTSPETTRVAIGPEGGFTDDELTAAAMGGWKLVSLGPRILRVETAAIVLAAAIAMR